MNIAFAIKELILGGESLVVRRLGRFYTVWHPAEFSKSGDMLLPPYRQICLDPRHLDDDGKLLGHLCRKYGSDAEHAGEAIDRFVDSILKEAGKYGKAVIAGLGEFEAYEDNLAFRSFIEESPYRGLFPPLNLPVTRTGNTHASKIKAAPVSVAGKASVRRRLMIPLTIATLAVVLFVFLYYTGMLGPLFTGNSDKTASDITGMDEKDRIVFGRLPEERADSPSLPEGNTKEGMTSDQTGDMPGTPVPQSNTGGTSVYSNAGIQPAGLYHIIAGSFRISGNAEQQMKLLQAKGFETIILPPGDIPFYLVSIGSFASRQQAIDSLDRYRQILGNQIWVGRF